MTAQQGSSGMTTRLRRGQILLSVNGEEMIVEIGRRGLGARPPIAAGDRISVTGSEATRGDRKTLRATRIVRGSETYEIKPERSPVRSTPKPPLQTPLPTGSRAH